MRLRLTALAALALLAGWAWAAPGGNWFGGQVTVPNAAASDLATLLSITTTKNAKQLTVRIVPGSTNTIYCGGSGVTAAPTNARVAINSTTPAYTWASGNSSLALAAVYCIATTADTVAFVDGLE